MPILRRRPLPLVLLFLLVLTLISQTEDSKTAGNTSLPFRGSLPPERLCRCVFKAARQTTSVKKNGISGRVDEQNRDVAPQRAQDTGTDEGFDSDYEIFSTSEAFSTNAFVSQDDSHHPVPDSHPPPPVSLSPPQPATSPAIVPNPTPIFGASVPNGRYFIRNVRSSAFAALQASNSELSSSFPGEEPTWEHVWKITNVASFRYFIQNVDHSSFAIPRGPHPYKGSPIVGKENPLQWEIHAVLDRKGKYLIASSMEPNLLWNHGDDENGTPLMLHFGPTNPRNHWEFIPVQSPPPSQSNG